MIGHVGGISTIDITLYVQCFDDSTRRAADLKRQTSIHIMHSLYLYLRQLKLFFFFINNFQYQPCILLRMDASSQLKSCPLHGLKLL